MCAVTPKADISPSHCHVRFVPPAEKGAVGQLYERWDGKGLPRGLSGNAVKLPVRLVTLAQDAIALTEAHGFETMTTMIAKRAGGAYERELADLFLAHAGRLFAGLDGPVDRETFLAPDITEAIILGSQPKSLRASELQGISAHSWDEQRRLLRFPIAA